MRQYLIDIVSGIGIFISLGSWITQLHNLSTLIISLGTIIVVILNIEEKLKNRKKRKNEENNEAKF